MKYPPEDTNTPTEGVPSAEPGVYLMKVAAWKEDIRTKSGVIKDVIDFVGDGPDGVAVGASLWMRGPYVRPDGSKSKGTVWQYRELAKALGDEAVKQYRTKDANGHSIFDPMDWTSIPVKITVDDYGVEKIEEATAAAEAEKTTTPPAKRDDDEIPF